MTSTRLLAALSLALIALPAPASALAQDPATNHDTPAPSVRAARLDGTLAIDGRLDDVAWQAATPASAFRQSQPDEGADASFPFEVRFLHDDDALYVGARMRQPAGVVAPLARRDQLLDASGDNGSFNSLTTDKLIVRFDPYHNHIDDAWFEVNPAGVRGDQFNGDPSWDPIWEAATHLDAEGWTAEMRIPFSQLRFSPDSLQTWGLQIQRYVDSNNEQDMWAFRPRGEASGPSFYGHLAGLEIGKQPRQIEMLPYVVTGSRFDRAPDGDPYSDGHEMRLGMGADLKVLLTPNLTLDATINPDFGQVEVDPASLNLSAFETFYDEKRPFFVAGRSAFGFGGMRCMFCTNSSGLSAFYSRRIGRSPQLAGAVRDASDYSDIPDDATILGAAKITGRTDAGYGIGLLNAVTGRESARYLVTTGAEEEVQIVEPLTNYFVGRVRKELRGGASTMGGILTSVIRGTDDPMVADRLHSHAEAAGFDWTHTWDNRTYGWMGSVLFSSVAGSPEAIARTQRSSTHWFQRPDRGAVDDGLFTTEYDPDATSLRGYGLFSRVGKDNGTFLWELMGNVRSPGFEVNDLAFLHRTDYLWLNGNIGGQAVTPTRWYRSIFGTVGGAVERNFAGDMTRANLQAFYGMELPNYWNLRLMAITDFPAFDDQMTRGGPIVERPGFQLGSVGISTDARATAVFDVQVQGGAGIGSDTRFMNIRPGIALKPASNVFVQLSPSWAYDETEAQYVTAVDDATATDFFGTRYVFGFITTRTVSLTTRVNWTFTPDLTLQLFAQPFIASGDYSDFREFAAPRSGDHVVYGADAGTISYDEPSNTYDVDPDGAGPAAPFSFENPDFTTSALRGTAVLRWEYRPGSTLFFVWTQQRSGFDPVGTFDFADARAAIFDEPPMNVFQIKATYWFGR